MADVVPHLRYDGDDDGPLQRMGALKGDPIVVESTVMRRTPGNDDSPVVTASALCLLIMPGIRTVVMDAGS